MLSFHNDPAIKELYVNRVKAHQRADEIEKGIYWEKGRGCAVGCTIHSSNHSAYEDELGIPMVLAWLEDSIFEVLPLEIAKEWPLKFLEAIKVGADLSGVWPEFAIWLLTDEKYGVLQYAKTEESKDDIKQVSDGYKNYKSMTQDKWLIIRESADSDSDSDSAYAYAAYAATDAYYADDASDYAAAYASTGADSATYVANISKHKIAQADKLLELLSQAN